MSNKKLKKGFTLIELLTVVVIIGILTAIAAPSYFSNLETTRAREAIDILRQWQAARAIYFAEENNNIEESAAQSATRLQIAPIGNTNYFQCANVNDVSNNSILCTRRNNLFSIFATDTHMYCCWGDVRPAAAEKVCRSLSNEDNLAQGTLPQNSSCLEIIE